MNSIICIVPTNSSLTYKMCKNSLLHFIRYAIHQSKYSWGALSKSPLCFDLPLYPLLYASCSLPPYALCPMPYALCSYSLVRIQSKRRRKRINLMMYPVQHCIITPVHQCLVNPIHNLHTIILVHASGRDSRRADTNT